MFYIDETTSIINTPGIRNFVVIPLPENGIGHYFIKLKALMPQCKFNDYKHLNEPECAVIAAFENGKIMTKKYLSYIRIMEHSDIFD